MKAFAATVFLIVAARALGTGEAGACVEECNVDGSLFKDGCPDGHVCAFNGCGHTCRPVKREKKCPGVFCFMYCKHGWAKGDDGCEICECALLTPPTVAPTPKCSDVLCEIDCVYGFKTGSNGCPVCGCNDPDTLIG